MVLLLLDGNNNFMALGATNVDVNMKKINNRKTKSDIDDELKSIFLLFLDFIAITVFEFTVCNVQFTIIINC